MYSPSIEILVNRIDDFNEKYAMVENEKAIFSIEYAEFHWDVSATAGVLSGNRYGLVRMARDITLTAAASGNGGPSRECASRFAEGSDGIIILKEKPALGMDGRARFGWDEPGLCRLPLDERSYLEGILDSLGRAASASAEHEGEARIDWDGGNRAAFITGPERALLLLASEIIRFTLSASTGGRHEIKGLSGESGSLVLELKEE
ncbi:hypothetical protein BAC2_02576 [uncultured bacterium]|nr:hypothetical protein BAC2_02576 [uncultured bacterium]